MMSFQVFASFSGKDVRKSFLSHLLRSFSEKGIGVFMDTEEEDKEMIERKKPMTCGREIHQELKAAIQLSRVAVVVLSKNYASSTWCLDELHKIMGCARKRSTPVVPVYYEVDMSDVRHQKGKFSEDFKRHGEIENPETLNRWREALVKLTNRHGFSSHDSEDDSKLIRKITLHVSDLLSKSRLHKDLRPGKACGGKSTVKKTSWSLASDSDQLVATMSAKSKISIAMDRRMESIYGILDIESICEVRVIGVLGVPGIGKTTIARRLYHEVSSAFQDHCFFETPRGILDHFLGTQEIGKTNITKNYQKLTPAFQDHCFLGTSRNNDAQGRNLAASSGSQEELLSPRSLKRKAMQTLSPDLGSYDKKRARFQHQRVLVIIDNIDTIEQLEGIMKDVNSLGSGSRVIVTTQNKSLLLACGVEHVYEVDSLKYDEGLELFSQCAFKMQYPPANFEQLSVRAVQLTGCLPLGLKLLGSFLCGKTKEDWERELQRLEAGQDESIVELSTLIAQGIPHSITKEDWECDVQRLETNC